MAKNRPPKPTLSENPTREEVIVGYQPFVAWFVKRFLTYDRRLKANWHLLDDCTGEAMLDTVMMVDKYFAENREFNVQFEHSLRIISRRAIVTTYRRELRQRGESTFNLKIPPYIVDDAEEVDPFAISLRQTIHTACRDGLDAAIVRGIEEGKTQTQIAADNYSNRRTVQNRLYHLRRRLEKIIDELDD